MKDPVDHIERPRLPWRHTAEGSVTECGLDASKVKTLTRPEFIQRAKDMGRQRTALFTCMTCSTAAQRWGTWEDDPRMAMQREIEWEGIRGYSRYAGRGERTKDELLALAALVEAHRDEFDAHMTATDQRREWLKKKAAMGARTDAPRPRSL